MAKAKTTTEAVIETAEVEAVEVVEPKLAQGVEKLEEEGDIAADYLEALLDIVDLDGDIDIDVETAVHPLLSLAANCTTLLAVAERF